MTRTGLRALAPLLAIPLALAAPASSRAGDPPPPDAGSSPSHATPPSGAPPTPSADTHATPPSDAAAPPPEPSATPPTDAAEPSGAPASPPSDASKPGPPASPGPPAPGEGKGKEDNWLDVSHRFVEQRLFAPVLRLDRFFSDERDFEAERERSFLRWRSQVRLAEDSSRAQFTTGVTATLRLPGLNERLRRLRVVIAGETRDAVNALFPREPAAPGTVVEPTEEEAIGRGDAGLRFYLWDTLASHADLGGGILLELPPGIYGRVRFRWAFPVGRLFVTRLALVPFWRSDVKFGATLSGELDRPLWGSLLLRLSGSGTRSQHSNGLEWWSELAVVVPLPPRSAAQVGVGTTGATRAVVVAPDLVTGIPREWRVPQPDRSRVYARLRTDLYRRWLFVEIEPEIAWPWTPERNRYSAWGLMLRAEVQFQGKEAPPPAPATPPAPPEPKDPT